MVYHLYMDVSLELLWCISCIWMSRWVSCVYIPNLEQLPVLWKALKMAEAMKESESRIQIAGQNGAEMMEPGRVSISREPKVART